MSITIDPNLSPAEQEAARKRLLQQAPGVWQSPTSGQGFAPSPTASGPIGQATIPKQSEPRVYEPVAPPPQAQPGAVPFSMGSYLNDKMGASASRIQSIAPTGGGVVSSLGGGGQADSLGPILRSLAGGFNKANAANEARYGEAKNTLAGFGKSYENQINQNYTQDVAHQAQQATSRGLGNSSIAASMEGGARRRQQDALLGLKDRLAAQSVNLLQSKYDNAPDAGMLANLVAQASQTGAGGANIASILKSLGLA